MLSHKHIDKSSTDGHVLFLYDSVEEQTTVLADYFIQGLNKGELCVLVTADPLEDAIQKFESVGFKAVSYVQNGSLRIFEMVDTYLPNGQFVSEFMLGNVRTFIDDARSEGFSGIRTAGEMAWLNDHQESSHEACTYEEDVNYLATPDDNFIGLCMYPVSERSTDVIHEVVRSHPSLIYDGLVQSNPFYALA